MTHDERFNAARELVKAGEYENARALYKVPGTLPSDLRVIERRIATHQQHLTNANRTNTNQQSR